MIRRILPGRLGGRRVKSFQSRKKKGKKDNFPRLRVSYIAKLLLALVIIGFLAIGFWFYSQREWDSEERITVVIQVESYEAYEAQVFVFSYLPSQNTISLVSLPSDLKIEAVGDFGYWRVSSLFDLGNLEGDGGELLVRSVSRYLGTEIEGWIKSKEVLLIDSSSVRKNLKRLIQQSFIGSANSNLSLWDRLALFVSIGKVNSSGLKFIDLSNKSFLYSDPQPDGSSLLLSNPDELDNISVQLFGEPKFIEEGLSVAVFNGTNHSGLGNRVGRLLQNMEVEVVAVADNKELIDETKILAASEEVAGSFTVEKLVKLVNANSVVVEDTSSERAEVILVLGEDYWVSELEI